jgi:phospholipid/cholesterol/gamma-HCH transport system substrate-binding protein
MKISIENRARLAFGLTLLFGVVAGLVWYFVASGRYAIYEIRTDEAVSGLIADAPVEFHGVQVGTVKSIQLTGPRSISILLNVEKHAPVTTATVATITARGLATRGFTGYVYVSLEDVGSEARPLRAAPGEPYPLLPAAPSRSLNLDTAISDLNRNVQLVTDLLQAVLDQKTIASLKQSLDSLAQVTRTLARNNEKLASIISNTERASIEFQPMLKSSNASVKVLQNQILPEAFRALQNLENASSSLSNLANKMDRDPSILIRSSRPATPGPGEAR